MLGRLLHPDQLVTIDDRPQFCLVLAPFEPPSQHLPFVLRRRVADAHPDQEAVQLSLGQRIGALVLDRVLRGQHEERTFQRPGSIIGRHLALLHGLEQGGLRLRRSAVDLVGQQHVGEDRTRAELEL